MFTGLVKEMGTIRSVRTGPGGGRIDLEAPALAPAARVGDSLAVDGVCLTVTAGEGSRLSFDVSAETLRRSTLGSARPGDRVNLEDALTPSSPMGGHHVQGHVDGVARIEQTRKSGAGMEITVRVPAGLARYLVPKGSVAVDGVSLTINEVRGTRFTVSLVPHTMSMVTLAGKRINDRVNIEADILVKTVEHLLEARPKGGRSGQAPY